MESYKQSPLLFVSASLVLAQSYYKENMITQSVHHALQALKFYRKLKDEEKNKLIEAKI
jgi:hypothetical protein